MEKMENEFLKNRPQRLCHMCGKCCRVVTTSKSYEELKALAESGDESSISFLTLFEPYPSIDSAMEASKETVDNIINEIKENGNFDESKLTFYKCRHLMDNNLCGIYLNRHELCDRFPSSPWAVTPPGCGFEGWLFQKREEKKQQIRKQKENLLMLESMLKEVNDPEQIKRIIDTIEKTKKVISHFAKYGAENW